MSDLLILQLVISFFAGGIFIAALSFIAERVSSKMSGIILAIPSTAALGFFFIGWVVSPESVAEIVPGTLIPLGLCVFFPLTYIYFAKFASKYIKDKSIQIIVSFLVGTITWLLFAIPLVIAKINDLWLGIIGYFILITIAHILLNRKEYPRPKTQKYSMFQKLSRAAFVGFFIVIVVWFGKTLSPFWGGVLAMYPVAFSSSLMVLHWYYEPTALFPTMQKIPIGSISIFVYNITVMLLFPHIGFIWGTLAGYVTSLLTSFILAFNGDIKESVINKLALNKRGIK
ncbi:MAG: hypothetical protein JW866_08075 [Ignavibacteriales bacterium]|nr:hypothetical protein [Ignavibacteriales bacterium]